MVAWEGYLYRKDKVKVNTVNWRCSKAGCNGRLITRAAYGPMDEDDDPPVESGNHTHPPNPVEVEVTKITNQVKASATRTNDPPRRIVQDALVNASEEAAATVGSATNLREVVRRKRRREENYPQNPGRREDLLIPPTLRTTTDGRRFLQFDSGVGDGHRMLIFSTDTFLQHLHDAENWMCDGTFKVSPTLFYQVFTIHAVIRNNILPSVFVLLPNKQEATYERMWDEIKALKPGLSPSMVQIDFETGSMNAIRYAFPQAEVLGCYFHLGQSIWRKIQEQGLRNAYINGEDMRRSIKMVMALAFLPENEVGDAFDDVSDECEEALQPVLDYFEDVYLGRRDRRGRRRQARFPVRMWSVYSRQQRGLPRTNNQLESWHNAFQGCTETRHPSIYRFLEALRREEALQRVNAVQLMQGRDLTLRMKKYIKLNKRLTAVQNSRAGYTLLQYLRALSHNLEINVA